MSTSAQVTPVLRDPSNNTKSNFLKPRYDEQVQALMVAVVDANNIVIWAARSKVKVIKVLDDTWDKEHKEAVEEWEEYCR